MTDTVDDSVQKVATSDGFIDPLRSHQKEWVKFDDESNDQNGVSNATKIDIPTESVKSTETPEKSVNKVESSPAIIEVPTSQISQLSTIDLPPRREQEGFGNQTFLSFSSINFMEK